MNIRTSAGAAVVRIAIYLLGFLIVAPCNALSQASPDFSALEDEIHQMQSSTQGQIIQLRADLDKMIANSSSNSVNDRLQKIENQIKGIDDTLANLRNVRLEIADAAIRLSNAKFATASHFIEELALILAILALGGGLAGYIFKMVVENSILNKTEKSVSELVSKSIAGVEAAADTEKLMVTADLHWRFSFTYYEYYEPEFRWLLNNKFPQASLEIAKKIEREAAMARHMADRGLGPLGKAKAKTSNPNAWSSLNSALINLLLYNYTVECICGRAVGRRIDSSTTSELLRLSNECISLAEQFHESWVELHDTAAFCLIAFGDQQNKRRGTQIISDILAGRTPSPAHTPPDANRIATFRAEYGFAAA